MTSLDPNWFLFRAGDEAARLNHGWVGPEHVLLAILARPTESVAAAVLNELGITHERFSERLVAEIASGDPGAAPTAENGTSTSPVWHELIGRADGLAAGLGSAAVTADHLVIAFVWEPDSGVELEQMFDVKRETIIDALQAAGVATPTVAMRPSPVANTRGQQRVFVPADRVVQIAGMLGDRLPRGSGLGFNFTDDARAWVGAYADVELERHVTEVLADLESAPNGKRI